APRSRSSPMSCPCPSPWWTPSTCWSPRPCASPHQSLSRRSWSRMSYELLAVTGPVSPALSAQRRDTVERAAAAVPGATRWTVHETRTACAAVVTTAPPGGTVAEVRPAGRATRLTVATSPRGLAAAGSTREVGAEAGHVSLALAADGEIDLSTDGVGFLPCYWGAVPDGV